MSWLPFYADSNDFRLIHEWLNSSEELAFIVSDGPRRWRAVGSIPVLNGERVCLWHIPSGPLPSVYPYPDREVGSIIDPWGGWQELCAGADTRQPYFGSGHPGIIWLNVRPVSKASVRCIGLSSFEWIGNHYRRLGNAADKSTETFWRTLRRWTQKQGKKVPRVGPLNGLRAEIVAFPSALASFNAGAERDLNP